MKTPMSVWNTRHEAERSTSAELQPEADCLQALFNLVDECIQRLWAVDRPFGRVTAMVATKARNLALGCYTMAMDGLAQESGALLRPFIEALELLVYLRLDPARVDEVIGSNRPSAGTIAKRIAGEFQALRGHLNVHASHVSLTLDSMRHLLDLDSGQLRTIQRHRDAVLRHNLHLLFAMFTRVAIECVNCVSVAEESIAHDLADRVEAQKRRGLELIASDSSRQV
jgi:hypothetical protein